MGPGRRRIAAGGERKRRQITRSTDAQRKHSRDAQRKLGFGGWNVGRDVVRSVVELGPGHRRSRGTCRRPAKRSGAGAGWTGQRGRGPAQEHREAMPQRWLVTRVIALGPETRTVSTAAIGGVPKRGRGGRRSSPNDRALARSPPPHLRARRTRARRPAIVAKAARIWARRIATLTTRRPPSAAAPSAAACDRRQSCANLGEAHRHPHDAAAPSAAACDHRQSCANLDERHPPIHDAADPSVGPAVVVKRARFRCGLRLPIRRAAAPNAGPAVVASYANPGERNRPIHDGRTRTRWPAILTKKLRESGRGASPPSRRGGPERGACGRR